MPPHFALLYHVVLGMCVDLQHVERIVLAVPPRSWQHTAKAALRYNTGVVCVKGTTNVTNEYCIKRTAYAALFYNPGDVSKGTTKAMKEYCIKSTTHAALYYNPGDVR